MTPAERDARFDVVWAPGRDAPSLSGGTRSWPHSEAGWVIHCRIKNGPSALRLRGPHPRSTDRAAHMAGMMRTGMAVL